MSFPGNGAFGSGVPGSFGQRPASPLPQAPPTTPPARIWSPDRPQHGVDAGNAERVRFIEEYRRFMASLPPVCGVPGCPVHSIAPPGTVLPWELVVRHPICHVCRVVHGPGLEHRPVNVTPATPGWDSKCPVHGVAAQEQELASAPKPESSRKGGCREEDRWPSPGSEVRAIIVDKMANLFLGPREATKSGKPRGAELKKMLDELVDQREEPHRGLFKEVLDDLFKDTEK